MASSAALIWRIAAGVLSFDESVFFFSDGRTGVTGACLASLGGESSEVGSCEVFSPALGVRDFDLAGERGEGGGLRFRDEAAKASWRGEGTRAPLVWDLVVALLVNIFEIGYEYCIFTPPGTSREL